MATDFTSEAGFDGDARELDGSENQETVANFIANLPPHTPVLLVKNHFGDPLDTTLGELQDKIGALDLCVHKVSGGADRLIVETRGDIGRLVSGIPVCASIGGSDDMCG